MIRAVSERLVGLEGNTILMKKTTASLTDRPPRRGAAEGARRKRSEEPSGPASRPPFGMWDHPR